MGHLCSCHRAQKTWHGKAISEDYLLSRPTARHNGFGPLPIGPYEEAQGYDNGYQIMPAYNNYTLGQSPYATGPRAGSVRISSPSGKHKTLIEYSCSTLSPESGFSSTTSSSRQVSVSAPSTPEMLMRKKPPPKPPRMRTNTDSLLRTPTMSMRSAGVNTLKSSIVDVTNILDCTLSRSFDSVKDRTPSPMMERYKVNGVTHEKVFNILSQTKEFLAFELEPDGILSYLTEKGALQSHEKAEIKACVTTQAQCELLIDIITGKGHQEFMTFCTALRTVGHHGYLADFLEVLDTLVEIATTNIMKPIEAITRSPNVRVRAFSFEGDKQCSTCSCNNNDNEETSVFGDDSSFDIDISYINRDTDEIRSVREVSAMKRRRRPLSMKSENTAILEEADRYIPVISASLYNQCLAQHGIRVVAKLLENYHCIRELSLVKNHMNSESVKSLGKALEKNRGLTKLDIRLNQIGDEGAMYLAQGISRHMSLRTLNVTSTGLGGIGCSHMVNGISKIPRLFELDIGFNDMTEQACEAMAKCVSGNPSVKKLRMRCNGITPYGARCIFKGLRRNARVNFLDVSRNKISDESIVVLGEVLLANRTLREINLENCNITGTGCQSLVRALKSNTSLKSLDLSMNSIGDLGARSLSEGLKYNHAVDTLCLNMCNIGNVGFLSILDALRHNVTMSSLKLCYNRIGQTLEHDPDTISLDFSLSDSIPPENGTPETPVFILSPPPKGTSTPKRNSKRESGCPDYENIQLYFPREGSPESTSDQNGQTVIENEGIVNSASSSTLHSDVCSQISSTDTATLSDTGEVETDNQVEPKSAVCEPAIEPTETLVASSKPPDEDVEEPVERPSSPRSQEPPPSPKLSLNTNIRVSPSNSSLVSIPQSFFSSIPSTPIMTMSPPLTPRSPLTLTLKNNFTSSSTVQVNTVEQMYETLCDVLQQNKNLKVLLWGNNFDDGQEDRILQDAANVNSTGVQLRNS